MCQGRFFLSKVLLKMSKSIIFCGERLLNRVDSFFFQMFFNFFQKFLSTVFNKSSFEVNYNKSNVSQNIFSYLGLSNYNLVSNFFLKKVLKQENSNILGLYSLDDVNIVEDNFFYNFYIFQGYLGLFETTKIDVIFPCLNFYEKISTYYTNSNELLKSEFILTPSKLIFSDWLIFELNGLYFTYYRLINKPLIFSFFFKTFSSSVFYNVSFHLNFVRNYVNYMDILKKNNKSNIAFFSLTNEMFLFINRLQRDIISFNSKWLNDCLKFYGEFNFLK